MVSWSLVIFDSIVSLPQLPKTIFFLSYLVLEYMTYTDIKLCLKKRNNEIKYNIIEILTILGFLL